MKQLTIGESFNGFLKTLKVKNISGMNNQDLYTYIFENFLGDITAYLSPYTLEILENEGFIDREIRNKANDIRKELFDMLNGPHWNVESVKTSSSWHEIFKELEILDNLVHKKWTKEELEFLKTI